MGSYFGSSLCAVDLNQDGLSDLLVGAPMHSQLRDEGQVTVYLSKGNVSDVGGSAGPCRAALLRDPRACFNSLCSLPLFACYRNFRLKPA